VAAAGAGLDAALGAVPRGVQRVGARAGAASLSKDSSASPKTLPTARPWCRATVHTSGKAGTRMRIVDVTDTPNQVLYIQRECTNGSGVFVL
jgi:hypothetical protein